MIRTSEAAPNVPSFRLLWAAFSIGENLIAAMSRTHRGAFPAAFNIFDFLLIDPAVFLNVRAADVVSLFGPTTFPVFFEEVEGDLCR